MHDPPLDFVLANYWFSLCQTAERRQRPKRTLGQNAWRIAA
jgi:hypothetical protein